MKAIDTWEVFSNTCPWRDHGKCMAQLDGGSMGLRWNRECKHAKDCAIWKAIELIMGEIKK